MAIASNRAGGRRVNVWRIAAWSMAGLILLLPLLANAPWTGLDYLFAGVLIGGVGLAFELTVRTSRNSAYRAGVGFALAATFLIIWANGAVGMVGDEDDPFNLLFDGVVLLALAGAFAARFGAAGMALTMAAAGIVQAGFGIAGMSIDPRGGALSAGFGGLWLISAALFWIASRDRGIKQG